MRFQIIKTVFFKEVREMLRDRRAMAVMFGVPLILYPLLTVGLGALSHGKVKELKETRYKIAIVNAPGAPELSRRLTDARDGFDLGTAEHASTALADGTIHAVVEIPQDMEHKLLAGDAVAVSIRLDSSRNESRVVENRIGNIIDDYQTWIVGQRLRRHGISDDVLKGIGRNTVDVASASQRMGNYLAQLLPLLVLITGMLGALFPALSATTTERELGTLETLLVTPAGRGELLCAKALLVMLCGMLTSFLNVLSMSLVLLHTFSMADKTGSGLSISFASLALMFLAAVPALAFFTTCVLIVGMIARNYKEANSYATPAMLLPIASLALTIADVKTTAGLLVTPIANTTLVMRDVLRGRPNTGEFLLAFVSSLVYAGLLLSLAARLFSNEQLVNPAWEPLSLKGLGKRQRKARLPAVDEAIALFFISLLLLFYIQPRLLGLGLFGMLVVTQVLLIFGPAAIFAWLGKWDWRQTFKLNRAPALALLGAALIGIGLAPVMGAVSQLMQQFFPVSQELKEHMEKVFGPVLAAHPILAAVAVGALAGIFEELFFRGPIQTALGRRNGRWMAIIVAALLFAAAHMDLRGFPIRLGLGIVLGWLVVRSGSIFPAMLMHGMYDATALLIAAAYAGAAKAEPALDPWLMAWIAGGLGAAGAGGWLVVRSARQRPGTEGTSLSGAVSTQNGASSGQ